MIGHWFLFFIAFGVSVASAQTDEGERAKLINQGLDAYSEAQSVTDRNARVAAFTRAEQLFTQAAGDHGANADLYANAGTAALQAERLGPAVLAFRRALELDPDHGRATRNLAHARSLLPDWLPKPHSESVLDTFFFWHRSLSTVERIGAGAVCFLLAALGFAVAIRWHSRLARSLALLPAFAWLGLSISLAMEAGSNQWQDAVITAEETVARAADSANAPARFPDPLPGGTEVKVLEARERWARIRLANEREAWVNRQSLEMIRNSRSPSDQDT